MRLDVTFDIDERPEAQHQLKQIPPSSRVDHPKLKAAIVAYEEARKAEREARQTHVQLEQELPAAEYKDELALADARQHGKSDPGPKNAERHLKAIAEARRDAGARKITLARSIEGVVAAFEEHGETWRAALEDERDGLRGSMAELVDGWERLHRELQANSANRSIAVGGGAQAASLFADAIKVPQIIDGDMVKVADVLDGLRGLAAPQEPNEGAADNMPAGAEPTRHRPPSEQPFAGLGSQSAPLGARVDPEQVKAWVEADEAAAVAAAAPLSEERRAERLARAESRKFERAQVREADRENVEAVR